MLEEKVNVDLEMKLLAGLPIEVLGIGKIFPVKLKDIAEVGESVYSHYLSILCFEIDQLLSALKIEQGMALQKEDINPFIFIISQFINNNDYFINLFLSALEFFLKSKVIFSLDIQGFWIGEEKDLKNYLKTKDKNDYIQILTNNNYEYFKEVLKLQNCLKGINETYNPADEKTKYAIEKMKRMKAKLVKLKSKEDPVSLSDLISSMIVYNKNMEVEKIWNLTFYQFNNYFKRMQMIIEYENSIQSLIHGADSNKIELKYFIRQIED